MNETSAALVPADAALVYPLALVPALPPIDAEAAGLPDLPSGHPQWQRDVVSISSRARALIANVVPVVVRTLAYWDHRLREVAFGARTLSVDPAGCYRLR
ncbi:MAG: hypothetical protein ABSH03_21380 [Candidatus Lustribacter sp.]|jgi:hypothetical protein